MYNKEVDIIGNNRKKRLLTPKYDVIFKALFGRKGSEEILKGLLNTILTEQVKSVQLNENPILLQEYPEEKLGILDVVAKINDEEIVDIEIQLNNKYNLEKRLLSYWGKKYNEKLNKGDKYKKLKKTIIIALVDFEIRKIDAESAHVMWKMNPDYKTKEELFGDIEIHIIEMPKVLKNKNIGKELRNWIEFILNPESEGVKMSIKEDVTLNKAYEKLEEISNDEYLREIEELKWKAISDEANLRDGAREEGIKEVAKRLLDDGMKPEKVAEITELPLAEINKL